MESEAIGYMADKGRYSGLNELIKSYEEETGTPLAHSQVSRYLREGILPQPEEGDSFGERHLERLRMIEHIRSRYGMSLRDISGLFGVIDADAVGETAEGPGEDRQAADRRERIIDNATDLFAAKGYHGTTIDEIVQATGIAKGTFYIYFESKEELLVEVIKRLIDGTLERIDRERVAGRGGDFIARIESMGQELLELYLGKSELLYMLLGETVGNARLKGHLLEVYEKLAERIEDDIREGVEAGEVFPFHDLRTVSYALLGMGQSIAIMVGGGGEAHLEKTRKTVHEFISRALSAKE